MYFLCNDIALSAPMTMLFSDNSFDGVFDGNNKVIRGLVIHEPSSLIVGLFRTLGRNAVIQNLTLEAPDVAGSAMVGALAGMSGGRVSEVHVNGGSVMSMFPFAGGLIGVQSQGAVIACSADAAVNVSGVAGTQMIGAQSAR